jgi:hypothetical protein
MTHMTVRLVILALMVTAMPAHARMYQWTDPDTGTTQLSGKPPAWYRSSENGPRVIVFEKGEVVDDTSIQVSDALREELRRQALAKAVEDREKARQMALEAEQLKSRIGEQPQEDSITTDVAEETKPAGEPETAITAGQTNTEVPGQLTEDQLKALIMEWEQQKTQQSKAKIGADPLPQE